jgi:hypothetical protein
MDGLYGKINIHLELFYLDGSGSNTAYLPFLSFISCMKID